MKYLTTSYFIQACAKHRFGDSAPAIRGATPVSPLQTRRSGPKTAAFSGF